MDIESTPIPSKIKNIVNKVIAQSDISVFLKRKVKIDRKTGTIRVGKKKISYKEKNLHLVSLGKASGRMASFFLDKIYEDFETILIITPKYAPIRLKDPKGKALIVNSGHPVPDEDSLRAGRLLSDTAERMGEKDLVVYLISGGGSALVEKPLGKISIEDLIETNRLLLNSGATIREVNTVRKHISDIKGGRLAEKTYPAFSLTLLASDVPGDRPEDIASGPTVPDPTTYNDALKILELYGIRDKVPRSVISVLEEGALGKLPETPKPGNPIFDKTLSYMVATPHELLLELKKHLRRMGYRPYELTSRIVGESREIAKALASIAIDAIEGKSDIKPPAAVIMGGETSVTVKGKGMGGRAQELVVWFAREIYEEKPRAILIAMDTDGIDGITPVAGGYADENTWALILEKHGRKAIRLLKDNDTYTLLNSINHTIKTGFTGTNLNNVIIMLLEAGDKPLKY